MSTRQVKVWDLFVRLFHWSLVCLFITAYVSGEEESAVHVWAGYGIALLLLLRVIWGFVGSRYARFSSFLRPPSEAVAYVKGLLTGRSHRYLGHNPAGGWMVIMLILSLAGTGISGLIVYGAEGGGPLAASPWLTSSSTRASATAAGEPASPDEEREEEHDDRDERYEDHDEEASESHDNEQIEEFWEEIHEFFANLSLALVILHILGVIASSLAHGENLLRSMLTGDKRSQSEDL